MGHVSREEVLNWFTAKKADACIEAGRRLLCTRCRENPRRRGGRDCLKCHALEMSVRRKSYRQGDPKRRHKESVRSRAQRHRRKGRLVAQECRCGAKVVEMHHESYESALDVEWVCRLCHLKEHGYMLDDG